MVFRLIAAAVMFALLAPHASCADEDEDARLSQAVLDAEIVCFGWLENAKPGVPLSGKPGTVELYIAKCFKGEKLLPEPRVITIHRDIELPKDKTMSGAFFIKTEKEGFNAYRFEDGALPMARYVSGLLELPKDNASARLEYAFDHLEHETFEVALAARVEFELASVADLGRFGKIDAPLGRIRRGLRQHDWDRLTDQLPTTLTEYERELKRYEELKKLDDPLVPLFRPLKPAPEPGKPLRLGEIAAKRGVPDAAVIRWREEIRSRRLAPADLYVTLLGLRGAPEDRPLLREFTRQAFAATREKELKAGLEAFARHTPADGLAMMREVTQSPDTGFWAANEVRKVAKRLSVRYPDGMKETDLDTVYAELLNRPDCADLVASDLGDAKNWRLTEKVLAMHGKKGFDLPIIRRQLIRYCLRCPLPAAAEYVERMRKEMPERVKTVEELLKIER